MQTNFTLEYFKEYVFSWWKLGCPGGKRPTHNKKFGTEFFSVFLCGRDHSLIWVLPSSPCVNINQPDNLHFALCLLCDLISPGRTSPNQGCSLCFPYLNLNLKGPLANQITHWIFWISRKSQSGLVVFVIPPLSHMNWVYSSHEARLSLWNPVWDFNSRGYSLTDTGRM